ncbi:MAG TPA: hypothetical protein VF120_03610 [Ktedonobacterales bacterium]
MHSVGPPGNDHDAHVEDNAQGELETSDLGPGLPGLSRRARARRLLVSLAAVLLGLAVILGSIPALRQSAIALVTGPTPTPTPPTIPDPTGSSFYFLLTPPWVHVLVDGRQLTQAPISDLQAGQPVGLLPPLRLPHGTHVLEWSGAPFQLQHCTLRAPVPFFYNPGGGCALQQYTGGPAGFIVQQRESLATLAPDQASALLAAINAGFVAASASATITPGEHYLTVQGEALSVATTRTPLHATLRFTATTRSLTTEPCTFSPGIQPCRFPGQDCRQLCTTTLPTAPSDPSASADWLAAIPVHSNWQLGDAGGASAGELVQTPGPDDFLALLRISWDGAAWHVTPVFGHAQGHEVADDTICAPARDWLSGVTSVQPTPIVPPGLALQGNAGGVIYVSDADPTDGCFVLVPPTAFAPNAVPLGTPAATLLLRFGVLLALNGEAHQIAPDLPVADATEQAIAQRIQLAAGG